MNFTALANTLVIRSNTGTTCSTLCCFQSFRSLFQPSCEMLQYLVYYDDYGFNCTDGQLIVFYCFNASKQILSSINEALSACINGPRSIFTSRILYHVVLASYIRTANSLVATLTSFTSPIRHKKKKSSSFASQVLDCTRSESIR